jgi:hypothetical protein
MLTAATLELPEGLHHPHDAENGPGMAAKVRLRQIPSVLEGVEIHATAERHRAPEDRIGAFGAVLGAWRLDRVGEHITVHAPPELNRKGGGLLNRGVAQRGLPDHVEQAKRQLEAADF